MKAIIYEPRPTAHRLKFYIPYRATDWRTAVKKLDTSWYHPEQKLWSILNTPEHMTPLQTVFKDAYDIQPFNTQPKRPHRDLDKTSDAALECIERQLVLAGYS